jgi:hypothetical protein
MQKWLHGKALDQNGEKNRSIGTTKENVLGGKKRKRNPNACKINTDMTGANFFPVGATASYDLSFSRPAISRSHRPSPRER